MNWDRDNFVGRKKHRQRHHTDGLTKYTMEVKLVGILNPRQSKMPGLSSSTLVNGNETRTLSPEKAQAKSPQNRIDQGHPPITNVEVNELIA